MSETAKIVLRRPGRIVGCGASASVLLDGKVEGQLGNDSTLALNVPAGHHVLTVRSWGWGGGSHLIHLDLSAGQVCELECAPTWGNRQSLAGFIPATYLLLGTILNIVDNRLSESTALAILLTGAVVLFGAMFLVLGAYFRKWGLTAFDLRPTDPANPSVRIEKEPPQTLTIWLLTGLIAALVSGMVFFSVQSVKNNYSPHTQAIYCQDQPRPDQSSQPPVR